MRGRKPTPMRLKILKGNPGKRPLNGKEPQPKPGTPRCPPWLSDNAKREWRRLAAELGRLGLLTVLDVGPFAAYCEALAAWIDAQETLQAEGATYKTAAGLVKRHPAAGIAEGAMREMLALGREFGLTPSSRCRIDVEPPREEDALDRLLNR